MYVVSLNVGDHAKIIVMDEAVHSTGQYTRFTDYPFRKANLTPSQLDWRAKRDRAIKLYRESGDSSLAEEIGLFWNKDDEERAREAQRLRFTDNPFSLSKLSDSEMSSRYQLILARRRERHHQEDSGPVQAHCRSLPGLPSDERARW